MEVKVEGVEQTLPEGYHIAVRVGDVQKQTLYDAKKVYRFPEAKRFGRIDIFQRVGWCEMAWGAEEPETRTCKAVGPAGDTGIRLKVSLARPAGVNKDVDPELPAKTPQKPPRSKEAGLAAKRYLQEHDVEGVLTGAMRALLKQMPADPPKFLCDYISRAYGGGPAATSALVQQPPPPATEEVVVVRQCGAGGQGAVHRAAEQPQPQQQQQQQEQQKGVVVAPCAAVPLAGSSKEPTTTDAAQVAEGLKAAARAADADGKPGAGGLAHAALSLDHGPEADALKKQARDAINGVRTDALKAQARAAIAGSSMPEARGATAQALSDQRAKEVNALKTQARAAIAANSVPEVARETAQALSDARAKEVLKQRDVATRLENLRAEMGGLLVQAAASGLLEEALDKFVPKASAARAEEEAAATKIQAINRGRKSRASQKVAQGADREPWGDKIEALRLRAKDTLAQADREGTLRRCLAEVWLTPEMQRSQEVEVATKIQSLHRGKSCRKLMKDKQDEKLAGLNKDPVDAMRLRARQLLATAAAPASGGNISELRRALQEVAVR